MTLFPLPQSSSGAVFMLVIPSLLEVFPLMLWFQSVVQNYSSIFEERGTAGYRGERICAPRSLTNDISPRRSSICFSSPVYSRGPQPEMLGLQGIQAMLTTVWIELMLDP
ncbi:hypothetical protein C8J56DRAFT_888371 [Mycena floridula]|nr:hypothetical protein C8J56DRAFT_888371 [Mycena floridula]